MKNAIIVRAYLKYRYDKAVQFKEKNLELPLFILMEELDRDIDKIHWIVYDDIDSNINYFTNN